MEKLKRVQDDLNRKHEAQNRQTNDFINSIMNQSLGRNGNSVIERNRSSDSLKDLQNMGSMNQLSNLGSVNQFSNMGSMNKATINNTINDMGDLDGAFRHESAFKPLGGAGTSIKKNDETKPVDISPIYTRPGSGLSLGELNESSKKISIKGPTITETINTFTKGPNHEGKNINEA